MGQLCQVNAGHILVNLTDAAPASVMLTDRGESCLLWD